MFGCSFRGVMYFGLFPVPLHVRHFGCFFLIPYPGFPVAASGFRVAGRSSLAFNEFPSSMVSNFFFPGLVTLEEYVMVAICWQLLAAVIKRHVSLHASKPLVSRRSHSVAI